MIETTVGDLLQIAINDKTPKVRGAFEQDGATCFNGGIALALGMPAGQGSRVINALNKVKLGMDRLPRGMRSLVYGRKQGLGIGNLTMRANDDSTMRKATIARKLMEQLTPQELAQPVKVIEPRRAAKDPLA